MCTCIVHARSILCYYIIGGQKGDKSIIRVIFLITCLNDTTLLYMDHRKCFMKAWPFGSRSTLAGMNYFGKNPSESLRTKCFNDCRRKDKIVWQQYFEVGQHKYKTTKNSFI